MDAAVPAEKPRLGFKLTAQMAVAVVAAIVVSVTAFALSFHAISAVSEAAAIPHGLSWGMPIAIDGAMTVGTITGMVFKILKRDTRYAWFVLLFGVTISVAFNALHAMKTEKGPKGQPIVVLDDWQQGVVSAIPAVALALSIHLLAMLVEAIGEFMEQRKAEAARTDETRTVPVAPLAPTTLARTEPVQPIRTEPVRPEIEARTDAPYDARTARTDETRTESRTDDQPRTDETRTARTDARTEDTRTAEPPRTDDRRAIPPVPEQATPADDQNEDPTPEQDAKSIDRAALVVELASEIMLQGDEWKPDYNTLMERTGFKRSWCERVVRDARRAAAEDSVQADQ